MSLNPAGYLAYLALERNPHTSSDILNLCNASIVATGSASGITCQYVTRPISQTGTATNNFPTSLTLVSDNLAKQAVRGLDFELSYRTELGSGQLNTRLLASRMLEFSQTNAPGLINRHFEGTADNAGLPLPKWRGTLDVTYTNGGLTAGISERYIGSFDRSHPTFNNSGALTFGNVYAQNKVPVILYTDLNLSYKIKSGFGDVELFTVVNNLLDQKPPVTPSVNVSPGLTPPYYVNTYSLIGRYVTAGIRVKI